MRSDKGHGETSLRAVSDSAFEAEPETGEPLPALPLVREPPAGRSPAPAAVLRV